MLGLLRAVWRQVVGVRHQETRQLCIYTCVTCCPSLLRLGIDSIDKLRSKLGDMRGELQDTHRFQEVYNYSFQWACEVRRCLSSSAAGQGGGVSMVAAVSSPWGGREWVWRVVGMLRCALGLAAGGALACRPAALHARRDHACLSFCLSACVFGCCRSFSFAHAPAGEQEGYGPRHRAGDVAAAVC